MGTLELFVWSAMFGGLATLAAFALVDALLRRRIASWRSFIFVALTGAVCVLMSGLVRTLVPGLSPTLVHVLQNSLGLLSGALALHYLGLWLGVAMEDRIVHFTVFGGTLGLVAAAGVMAVLSVIKPPEHGHALLAASAAINGLAVLLPALACVRAVLLGDRLAWGMLVATGLLAFMVAGLYAQAMRGGAGGVGMAALTAVCTIGFFMVGTYLALRRDRVNKQLERLAGLATGADPATGLPKGSVLISKVDDAFWRCGRMKLQCTVICLHVRNLYELAETVGHHADQQILAALCARMRRAVGFRNILGLYHPRCFVVVLSTDSKTRLVEKTLERLHYLMALPLPVTALDDTKHLFVARFGIGVVSVALQGADPARIIDKAERLALAPRPQGDDQTRPGPLLA